MFQVGRRTRSRPVPWALAGLAGLILLVLVGWAIWRVPQLLYSYVSDPRDRANAEATTRTGMLAGLAGVAALVSLVFTSRAAQVGQETFRLTRRGQLTERYTRAIDQLGSKSFDVRLGGIYALEQLVQELDSDSDRNIIVEVLSAFVREHSHPVFRYRSHLEWLGQEMQTRPAREKSLAMKHVSEYPLPGDVRAAVTVLGRLPRTVAGKADLMGAYLRGVVLDRADLSEAKLVRVDLSTAHLHRAKLTGAHLEEANLTDAWLVGADLTGAHLRGANLTGAWLAGVLVDGTWHGVAQASDMSVGGAPSEQLGADLTGADLTGAVLTRADRSGVDLTGTTGLVQAQVDGARLDGSTGSPSGVALPGSGSRR